MSLKTYIESLQQRYPRGVKLNSPLGTVPPYLEPLQELYALSDGLELPFGCIFTAERALQGSKSSLFLPDWFCFGWNGNHTFWLCLYEPDDNGLWLTSWCPESRKPIGEAVCKTVEEFLTAQAMEYQAATV